MRRDELPAPRERRSSSRPVPAPKPGMAGPLRELKQLLHQLYVEAASPSYEAIEAWMKGRPGQLGKTAVGRYLTEPTLPPNQQATITLGAVLAGNGPRDVDDVRDHVRRLWVAAHDWTPLGIPIEQLDNPFALEVHEAITVDGNEVLPLLPPYLERVMALR